jgi:hypothetical protein
MGVGRSDRASVAAGQFRHRSITTCPVKSIRHSCTSFEQLIGIVCPFIRARGL